MCGIAGFCDYTEDYQRVGSNWLPVLKKMNRVLKHRGPDEDGIFIERHCALAHVRLSILDLAGGHQPMTRCEGLGKCTISYNGEIYNMPELRGELLADGIKLSTTSDTEVILAGYMRYGWEYVKRLNGIFSFAIWDGRTDKLLLFRDRAGVKPLFYCKKKHSLIFSSEIKGILQYPGMDAVLDREGLCEIFGLGPAKSYGKGVLKGIEELLPGHFMEYDRSGMRTHCYWKLVSQPHTDSYEKTVEKTAWLVTDAVRSQMLSDVPVCTFLSGGVDSSLVTAICARECERQGKVLDTFSFDFKDNDKNFKANSFQPSQDRPYVDQMVDFAGTRHRYLECTNRDLYEHLFEAVDARDLPCMADVESSMLYFCRQVAQYDKVTLTGECADEIFGGYPWFHKQECFDADIFPWSMDFEMRRMLLKDEVLRELPLEEYAKAAYQKTVDETPVLPGENAREARRREISYLNLKWFMQTLLDRMDRTSMHSGLEARVPFADHRIIEYVWNVPWDMKCRGGVVKGLLRAAGEEVLPHEILYRKKSPYPKTYDPDYEHLLKSRLMEVMSDSNAPLTALIDRKKAEAFIQTPSDYGRPFYGQLMAGPQLIAYLLQINYWLEHYRIRMV
ncbi:asparagine synthase (glutamine-hydrolyzing) [Ruminococcus gauvreauii]|uniref:asparagine synthase (glutamine-hydrolyzing) n=1 Tax=Ruminococcus gauvreauii TaxID=438033 RepID=A0ABY5VIF1_9FIRM|nr:asparagine synthase (glutamine-hydrolyzing) [Ruminococcus gauvreauii]UWP60182.1 asparagine synthase (glutamine-hydrolyzing) [Ruminococcus gauvreauii]